MRSVSVFIIFALFTSLLVGAAAAPGDQGPRLRLHRAILDAPASIVDASTLAALTAAAPGAYAIIQLAGPITVGNRAALEATGVTLLEYLPDFAYLVRGSPAQIDAAARLPQVYLRQPFTVADKLAPALLRALARGVDDVGVVAAIGWPNDAGELARDLRALAIDTTTPITVNDLLRVASLPSVRWIEPVGRPRLLNDVARTIMRVNSVWQNRSLFGAGQIVAITDSGLDTGITATLSPDFAGRLAATHVLSPTGDLGDNNGHGTHVAGSVAGAGVQSGAITATHQYSGSFAGVAPEASMVIQAFEVDAGGMISGLPNDYYPLFGQTYSDGARLHTNSWGDNTGPITDTEAAYGGYPYGSQRVDEFVWDNPDMTIFFAAGNSGVDGTPSFLFCVGGDGVIDPDSLLAPGTAKNVITVGAAESLRSSGGLSAFPWLLLNFCFATQPIATDLISNNSNGMAAFSSRGPTDDGRVKPDLVAPGTNIVSNRSHYPGATTLWGQHETNSDYAYSGGTSMATPLTAGAGVLAREWLTTRGLPNPSAAAVKATLLNTTADMAPGQYGTGATQEIPFTRPNSAAGWGRADLGFITAPFPYALWVDDHTAGLSTGSVVTYTHALTRPLEVVTDIQPLRVMLTWTDPPASLSASAQLVNDLDLVVYGPGGAIYYGNNIPPGDRVNNVEGVIIISPPVGQYTVVVSGYIVPIATQPYALTVGGPISTQGEMFLSKTANPATTVAPGGLITYTLALSAGSRAITQAITLTDTLPLSTTFDSASDGGMLNGSTVQWSIPSLAANATITRSLVVQVAANAANGTPIVNAAYRADNGVDIPGVGAPVTVIVTPVNAPPVAGDDTASTLEDTSVTISVLSNDSDVDGPSLTVSAVGTPSSGAASTDGTTVVYTPTLNFNGTDVFTYTASDGSLSDTASVTVTVQAPLSSTLALTKTADPAAEVAPGRLITYALNVGAQGGSVAGVVLTDTLPLSTTFASASGTFSGPVAGIITWVLGDLASGQTVTRTLTVSVPFDIPRSATISNMSYRASGANANAVDGTPVIVMVQELRVWLPLVLRQ